MKTILSTAAAILALSGTAALAEGDVDTGERDFKKCKACHAIVDPAGEVIVKGGKTGPNLWGVVGRAAGTDENFKRYSDELVGFGADGFVWTEEEVAAYVPNAGDWLADKLGLDKVRTAMTPQRVKDPADVAAYLAQYATPAEDGEEADAEESDD